MGSGDVEPLGGGISLTLETRKKMQKDISNSLYNHVIRGGNSCFNGEQIVNSRSICVYISTTRPSPSSAEAQHPNS
jgi:hypothetical protein